MRLWVIALAGLLPWHGAWAADPPVPLKPGDGSATTAAFCAICHTTDYIVMNSVFLPPAGWKAEVTKMRKAFGAPIDDATAETIITYLAANYAAPAP
jgi:hypothetical protein